MKREIIVLCALTLSACGIKGKLERPPFEEEQEQASFLGHVDFDVSQKLSD